MKTYAIDEHGERLTQAIKANDEAAAGEICVILALGFLRAVARIADAQERIANSLEVIENK